LPPALLDPSLAKAAIECWLPRRFGVKLLMDLPMLWSEQWTALGLRESSDDRRPARNDDRGRAF
jgi:hypothetical protein